MILPPELLLDSLAGQDQPFSVRALSSLPDQLVKLGSAGPLQWPRRQDGTPGAIKAPRSADLMAPRERGLLILLLRCPGLSKRLTHNLTVTLYCGEMAYAQTLFVKYDSEKVNGDWSATAVLLPIPPRQSYHAMSSLWQSWSDLPIEFWGGYLPTEFWK